MRLREKKCWPFSSPFFCSFNSIFYSSVGEGLRAEWADVARQGRQARSLTHLEGQVFFLSRRGFCGCVKMKHRIKDISPYSRGVGEVWEGSFFAAMEDQVKKNFQHLRCDDRVTQICPESDQIWNKTDRREERRPSGDQIWLFYIRYAALSSAQTLKHRWVLFFSVNKWRVLKPDISRQIRKRRERLVSLAVMLRLGHALTHTRHSLGLAHSRTWANTRTSARKQDRRRIGGETQDLREWS